VPRLRRSDRSRPGLTRRKRGRGFEYRDSGGELVDEETRARVHALAIPPAWTDVWVCADPLGHLQATGIDAAGRTQYLYHPAWRERRDREKFDRMLDFAAALPRVRRATERDLALDGLARDQVLACAVRLLDEGFFRIGGEEYAEDNGSVGLATMLKTHVTLADACVVTFDYPAKGGDWRVQSVVDAEVYAVMSLLKRRRGGGDELLAYKNGRSWADVRSTDINDYLREVAGGDFTAKDFRTWSATVLAASSVAVLGERADSATARKRVISLAVTEVAHYLGNTPAVCRASYVDPRVFDRFNAGETILPALDRADDADDAKRRRTVELAVIRLLDGGRRRARR
jgi:DNA topoisomerase-1